MAAGGAQEYLGVTPDLCTLGKAVGGGFPLSVFGGRHEIMERLMPEGDCQHSGTYNGHPVAVAAGLAAVTAYRQPGFYDHIHAIGSRLYHGPERDLRPARRHRSRAGAGGPIWRLFRRSRRDPRLRRRRAAFAPGHAAVHRPGDRTRGLLPRLRRRRLPSRILRGDVAERCRSDLAATRRGRSRIRRRRAAGVSRLVHGSYSPVGSASR